VDGQVVQQNVDAVSGQLQQSKGLVGVFDFYVSDHGHGQVDGNHGGHGGTVSGTLKI